MSRKRWLLFPLLALALVAVAAGGVAAAQATSTDNNAAPRVSAAATQGASADESAAPRDVAATGATSTRDRLSQKVASILGVTQDDLENAFQQARHEIQIEDRDARLDRLVERGVITADEATEIKAWLDARPAAMDKVEPKLRAEGHGGPDHEMPMLPRAGGLLDQIPRIIEGAVHAGRITEADAADIKAWLDSFPDELKGLDASVMLTYLSAQVDRVASGEDPLPPGVDGLVQSGAITSEQGDSLKAWLESKPDAAMKLVPSVFAGMLGPAGRIFMEGDGPGDLFGRMRERMGGPGGPAGPAGPLQFNLPDIFKNFRPGDGNRGEFEFKSGPEGKFFRFRMPGKPMPPADQPDDNGSEPGDSSAPSA